jgi:cation diffusion facilitator CzcD-associated flavoprotein CzcO/predicted ATP-grasp superfamily ATP-dependent carboligase
VRGLSDAGFAVTAAATTRTRIAAAHLSRSVTERLVLPDPLRSEEAFVGALERVVATGRFTVLMPGNDASLRSVSAGRAVIEAHVRLGLPGHERVKRSLDKAELAASAARHDLAPPPTTVCEDAAQALVAARELGFPVVVKPLSSIIDRATPHRRESSVLAEDAAELERAISNFGGVGLVQRRAQGRVFSFAGVFAGDWLLAEAFSRYRRTWHPDAGNACYSQTVETPAPLRRRIISLLEDLGWEGLFEFELIENGDAGWHVIDMNPRPYGSMALAIAAGANLPAIWCEHLLGHAPSDVRARPGVSYRWTDADVRYGLERLRKGDRSAAAAVLRVRRGVVHPYVRGSDVGPGLARLLELGGLAVRGDAIRRGSRRKQLPVAVIGAGPNGLAAAAHLRHAGIEALCFGEPLEAWSRHMPAGMLLRSRRRSSHIADPCQELTIDDYERTEGRRMSDPSITLEEFIEYGRWFQRRAVPDVDTRWVTEVTRRGRGFRLTVAGGDQLEASRVVVAAGLAPFACCPEPFAALPRWVRSHAYEHADLSTLAGQRVAVIGSGQSALESAALLNESGAAVEVLARAPSIYWLRDPGVDAITPAPPALRRRLSVSPPPTDVGGRVTGWIAAAPDVFRRVPRSVQPTVSYRCIRPAGAAWLRPRLAEVPISCACLVAEARMRDGEVELRLSDGSTRRVDHVLLGTGYRIDVRRYPFLARDIVAELELAEGYPVLRVGLESSVAGLHFMGAPAAGSFGPIMRFVVGSWYAAPAVARGAARSRQPPISFSFPTRKGRSRGCDKRYRVS